MALPAPDPFSRPADAGPDSPEDLAANRAGTLTPAQKRSTQTRLMPALAGALFGGAILVPILICFGPTLAAGVLTEPESGLEGWLPLLFFLPFGLVFLAVGVGALWNVWGTVQALLDLNAGRVEQADGRLVWKGRDYRGMTERRALQLLRGDERLPGAYRFYYLPRSGYILSAERLFLGGLETDSQAELRRALGDVFDFHEDDLPENAAGRLSGRQVAAQWWSVGRAALLWGLFLVPFLLVFGLVFPYLFVGRDWLAGEPVEPTNWIPALCAPAFVLLFAAIALGSLLNRFRDLLSGEVQMIEGAVEERSLTTGSGRSRRTRHYYEVNGQQFQVTAVALQALVRGRRYRLYYLPRSRHVVGVEPLRD